MSTEKITTAEENPDDVPPAPAAHETVELVEGAGEARPVNDVPADDFIGTRRLTDDDTGSKMTMA